MRNHALYTIVLDYKGGTYVGQAEAASVSSALRLWISRIKDGDLRAWKIKRGELIEIAESHKPIPLDERVNVWCVSGVADDALVLINVIATKPRRVGQP